jgi:hypothetical protein
MGKFVIRRTDTLTDLEALAVQVANGTLRGGHNGLLWATCRAAEQGYRDADIMAVLLPAAIRGRIPERDARRTIRDAGGIIDRKGTRGTIARLNDPEYNTLLDYREKYTAWLGLGERADTGDDPDLASPATPA